MRFSFGCFLICACLAGTYTSALAVPLPKGQRLLGVDVSNSVNATYDQAFNSAKNDGMEFTSLSLTWDTLENPNTGLPGGSVPGAYSNTAWAFADAYYSAYGVKLALMVGPVDTNNRTMPADLMGKAFNDPSVIARYVQVAGSPQELLKVAVVH